MNFYVKRILFHDNEGRKVVETRPESVLIKAIPKFAPSTRPGEPNRARSTATQNSVRNIIIKDFANLRALYGGAERSTRRRSFPRAHSLPANNPFF
jgi:hypothetical protein